MNRLDYKELLAEIKQEMAMKGGNFDAMYGDKPELLENADLIAAIALIAADRLYSRLTLQEFQLREADLDMERR
jgi:hypothetical protein